MVDSIKASKYCKIYHFRSHGLRELPCLMFADRFLFANLSRTFILDFFCKLDRVLMCWSTVDSGVGTAALSLGYALRAFTLRIEISLLIISSRSLDCILRNVGRNHVNA